MIEPPEPRRPEEGGGEEDDFLGEVEDDMLLDQLGGSGAADEDSELADMLGSWREDIDSEPLPSGTHPDMVQEIHDLNQQYENPARPSGPPRSTEGSTSPMSASEEAGRLRQIGGDTAAIAMYTEALSRLEESMAAIQGALGADHSRLGDALGPFNEAITATMAVRDQVAAAYGNLESIAGTIG